MNRKEWIEELDQLGNACRSFQHAYALDEDDPNNETLYELWDLTESIDALIDRYKESTGQAKTSTPHE